MNLSIKGVVVASLGLGRRLGFATANIRIAEKGLPHFGVYHVEAVWDGKVHDAVCNVGVRPT